MKKRLLSIVLASVLAIMPMSTAIYAEETGEVYTEGSGEVYSEASDEENVAEEGSGSGSDEGAEVVTAPSENDGSGEAAVTEGTENAAKEEDAADQASQESGDKNEKGDDAIEGSGTTGSEQEAPAVDAVDGQKADTGEKTAVITEHAADLTTVDNKAAKEEKEAEEKEAKEKKYPKFEYSEEKEGYTITLSADEGVLPEDTEVKIERITKVEDTEVADIIEDELPPETEIVELVVFDITFYSDNEEIEPKEGAVNVSIKLTKEMGSVLDEAEESEEDSSVEISVFHIDTDGEEAKAELVESEVNEENEVVFDAEEFSPYGIVLTATRKYTIRFNGNGATSGSMENLECEYGKTYDLPAVGFARRGYRFTGWNTKADGSGTRYANKAQIEDLTVVNGRIITFYAQWTLVTYTIDYFTSPLTNNPANPTTYDINTETITLKDPRKKQGFTFEGWYTYSASALDKKVTQIPKGSFGNKKLVAKVRGNRYTIHFNGNGATSGSMENMACEYGKTYNLPAVGFARRGYRFAGWDTKADGTGTRYANKAQIENLSVVDGRFINFYAQWTLVTYNITYNLNGAVNNPNPATYDINTETITLQKVSKKGQYFMGWYSDAEFKKPVTEIPKGSFGNKTFYARFRKIRYTLRYNGNRPTSGSMDDMVCVADKEYTLSPIGYAKRGYRFTGWNTKPDGSGTAYKNKDKIKNLTVVDGRIVSIFAQWRLVTYSVTYELNGGTNNASNPVNYDVTTATISLLDPTRSGYDFMGWYSDAACTKRVTQIPKGSIGNKVFYAKWGKAFKNITLNVPTRTVNQIKSYMANHPVSDAENTYRTAPSTEEPYSAGALSAATLKSALNLVNTYRYIAGLGAVTLNSSYNDLASKASLVNALNGGLSHTPARPAQLSAAKYDTLYKEGYEGASHSNIAAGTFLSIEDSVRLWMNDGDEFNKDRVGHRRWLLLPGLKEVGFGRVKSPISHYNYWYEDYYSAVYVSGDSVSYGSGKIVAWPAKNTPYGGHHGPWSVTMGKSVDASKVKINVKCTADGKEWNFSQNSSDGYFNVENSYYGEPGCIIFWPGNGDVLTPGNYDVTIYFYDTYEKLTYSVNLFE